MLCKLYHFVDATNINSIYYAIFHSHLLYVCTGWVQNLNSKHRLNLLQKKTTWVINFAYFDAQALPIFVELKIIKFSGLVFLFFFCNCLVYL